jgi:hypothetical protein
MSIVMEKEKSPSKDLVFQGLRFMLAFAAFSFFWSQDTDVIHDMALSPEQRAARVWKRQIEKERTEHCQIVGAVQSGARAAVLARLKDPGSALFSNSNVEFLNGDTKIFGFRGTVRAKDSSGGLVPTAYRGIARYDENTKNVVIEQLSF